MLSKSQSFTKRVFDVVLSIVLLPILVIPILLLIIVATIDTREFGLFSQERIGQKGIPFNIYKIRTLKNEPHELGHLNSSATALGKVLRHSKLDELPQLFNVLTGTMSFVGPRPDIRGFADELEGSDRVILLIKPGITCAATLKYKDEEVLLAQQEDPETYNRTIIWVDKVEINKKYIYNWSFCLDLRLLIQSIVS